MCEEVESSICIVPLIGLPASGKTHFSNKLKSYLEKKNVTCLAVCYDELVPLTVQKELRLEPGSWKKEREKIHEAVDLILRCGEGEDDNMAAHFLQLVLDLTPTEYRIELPYQSKI